MDFSSPLFWIFLLVYFITSAFTTAVGVGGGMLLLGVMGGMFPPAAVVPVHGVLMITSNLSRMIVMAKHVIWSFVWPLAAGAVFGTILGVWLNLNLPGWAIQLFLGSIMLAIVWAPKSDNFPKSVVITCLIGLVHGFLSSAFGMGGLIQSLLARQGWNRQAKIATQAAAVTMMNVSKTGVFIIGGFNFIPYLGLIVLGLFVGWLGTLAGKHLLDNLPEKLFDYIFKISVTLMALNLLRLGVTAAFWG